MNPGDDMPGVTRPLPDTVVRFIDSLPVVLYIAEDAPPRLRFISAGIERLLGYEPEEWMNDRRLWVDRLHPQDRYRVLEERGHSRAESATFTSEYRMLSRSRGTVWVRDQAMLLPNEGISGMSGSGGGSHWRGLIVDLTDQRLVEQQLRTTVAQHGALALLSQRALATREKQQLFTEAAALALETLDMSSAFVVERDRPERPLSVTVATDPSLEGQEVPPRFIAHVALDGSAPLTITDHRYEPGPGAPLDPDTVASAAVAIDCPGQSAAVLVLEGRRPRVFTPDDIDLLQSMANVLASALGRLATESQLGQALKLNALGRLSAGVAHDFNNVLSAVLGFGALLEPAVRDDPAATRHLAELLASAERAAGLVNQLLAFSRGQPTDATRVDLDEVIADMAGMLTQLLGSQATLRHEREGGTPTVWADRHQVEQVVMNLVINARDAMPDGGVITVRTRTVESSGLQDEPVQLRPRSYVVLDVEDEGKGMDPAVLDKVFEPFFSTKAKGEGTGLGLSTVLGIAQRHGGSVAVDSAVGRGTCFSVYLPEAPHAGVEDRPLTDTEPVEGPTGDEAPTAPIVVVDDQQAIRTLVREILVQQGYEVVEAEDGEQCLAAVGDAGSPVSLLLTDITMPGLTGPQLAQRMWDAHPGLPVVYMSGYADGEMMDPGTRSGPVHMLGKPFTLQQLLTAVASALRPATR